MQIAWHKRRVVVSKALMLASGYEPLSEALFSVSEQAHKKIEGVRLLPSTSIGILQYLDYTAVQNLKRTS